MQNAGLDELGLNWRYLAFDVLPEHLLPALEGTRSMRYVGLNLTVPYILALEWVDLLDQSARKWGAVNTVRFEGKDPDEKWVPLGQAEDPNAFHAIRSVGFNTDADAIATSINQDLGFFLERVALCFTGRRWRWTGCGSQTGGKWGRVPLPHQSNSQ